MPRGVASRRSKRRGDLRPWGQRGCRRPRFGHRLFPPRGDRLDSARGGRAPLHQGNCGADRRSQREGLAARSLTTRRSGPQEGASMIHQHIFAGPKPGMSEADFQDYWIKVHAVKYASRIRQIRRYSISRRLRPSSGDDVRLPFGGIAEIWLENEQEQLASLQSPEFIEGARADEPRWAAFWNTLGLDTTAHSPAPPAGITSSTGQ